MMSQRIHWFLWDMGFLEVLKNSLIYVQDVPKKGSVSLGHEPSIWGLIDVSKTSVNSLRLLGYLGLG